MSNSAIIDEIIKLDTGGPPPPINTDDDNGDNEEWEPHHVIFSALNQFLQIEVIDADKINLFDSIISNFTVDKDILTQPMYDVHYASSGIGTALKSIVEVSFVYKTQLSILESKMNIEIMKLINDKYRNKMWDFLRIKAIEHIPSWINEFNFLTQRRIIEFIVESLCWFSLDRCRDHLIVNHFEDFKSKATLEEVKIKAPYPSIPNALEILNILEADGCFLMGFNIILSPLSAMMIKEMPTVDFVDFTKAYVDNLDNFGNPYKPVTELDPRSSSDELKMQTSLFYNLILPLKENLVKDILDQL